jgi:hypothetical protein
MRPALHQAPLGVALVHRAIVACVLGGALAFVVLPGLALAADPSSTPAPASSSEPTPSPDPTATPDPTPTPPPDPAPDPDPEPAPTTTTPTSMNLFVDSLFRYQDPDWRACAAASTRSMLNFVAVNDTASEGALWQTTNSMAIQDRILRWARHHDTLDGGHGTDPHGWRNALNYFGWGPDALQAGSRVYDDRAYRKYGRAMKAAVRALISTGKPVGLAGWRGRHAQMITGYYGLSGDPFARNSEGRYANDFTVRGFYLSDPLRKSNAVDRKISYRALRDTTTYKWRFQRFYERDSKLDDPYTPGYRKSRAEWYRRFVLILPIR